MSWQESRKQIERVLASIPGAVDVKADYQANLTTITIVPDRDALARYGIDAAHVLDVVSSLGGQEVGDVFEGRARFPIDVRIPEEWREDIQRLKQLPVAEIEGKPVPLERVGGYSHCGDAADGRARKQPSPHVYLRQRAWP